MKIIKYKKLSGPKYKVFFEKETEYILYEDVIIKYNLLAYDNIDMHLLNEILKDNELYEAYYTSIKYIEKKIRTCFEIKNYLEKKEYDNHIIDKVIIKLKGNNILNDNLYIKSYIHDKLYLSSDGPYKIKKDLIKLGFKEFLIDSELSIIDEEEWINKAVKLVSKKIKNNSKYSSYILNNKIIMDMNNKGYPKEYYIDLLIEEDSEEIRNKEYQKIVEKLSKKYKDNELEYKIKQEMYKKGFKY